MLYIITVNNSLKKKIEDIVINHPLEADITARKKGKITAYMPKQYFHNKKKQQRIVNTLDISDIF